MAQSDAGRPGFDDRAAEGRSGAGAPDVGYDVVSGLHARTALLALLDRLGYRRQGGSWTHPERRTPVFLGGLVDRHGDARPCAPVVRELVDAGAALMTLGVEEFLEIERAADHAAVRSPVLAHAGAAGGGATADATLDRADTVAWLRTVPLWLDLPGLRVVHGCWSTRHVGALRDALDGNDLADDDALGLVMASHAVRTSIRILLAGATLPLPEHLWCLDARGELVRSARFRWWSRGPLTYRDRAVLPGGCTDLTGTAPARLDDTRIEHDVPSGSEDVPVVIARCSCAAGPVALSPTVLCLGVAGRETSGPVAYRWSGETALDAARIVHGA